MSVVHRVRPRALLSLSLFVVAVLAATAFGASAPPSENDGREQPVRAYGKLVRELPELRTRTAKTFMSESGALVARVYGGPVHFKDAAGRWQPIDETLARGAGKLRSKANGFAVELPEQLEGGKARVVEDERTWLAFGLRGARGGAEAVGRSARYRDVMPGVSLEWTSRPGSLKETLELANAQAERSFVFDLDLAPGLTPRLRDSGIVEVEDAGGATEMTIAAPWMQDAAGERSHDAKYALDNVDGAWRLTLTAGEWLDEPGRRWPVKLDPTVYPGPVADCLLHGGDGFRATNFCGADLLEAGHGHSPVHDHRSLLKFDVRAAVPSDAEVIGSALQLHLDRQSNSANFRELIAYRVTRSWSAGATWDRFDGVTAWSTPGGGGDFDTADRDTVRPLVGGNQYWQPGMYVPFGVADMTRDWLSGAKPNHGVLIKDDGASVDNVLEFTSSEGPVSQRPYMEIVYNRRIGERRGWQFEELALSDRMTAKVNVAGGNLLLRQPDLTIAGGLGPDLRVGRSYNSQTERYGPLGDGWTMDVAEGFKVLPTGNRSASVQMPSGIEVPFERAGGWEEYKYKTPVGYDATLNKTADGWALTEHKSQTKHRFDASGRHVATEDRNGRAFRIAYSGTSTQIASITDALGGQTTFEYLSNGRIAAMRDPAGRVWRYGFGGQGDRLASYTDPDVKATYFDYADRGMMTKVTTPGGRETRIEYFPDGDANARRVKSITRVTPSTSDVDPKWSFAYVLRQDRSGETVVTNPNTHTTKYVFDSQGRVTETWDGLGRKQSQSYDSNSNVETYTSAANTGTTPNTTLNYDDDGNLFSSTTPTGRGGNLEASATYGVTTSTGGAVSGGRYLPKTATNTQSRTRQFGYDANGNPTFTKDQLSAQNEVSYQYDPNSPGKLTTITDGRGKVTRYEYDARGLLKAIIPPLPLGATTITYDAVGRTATVKDGKAQTRTLSYDALDRVKKIAYSDGSSVSFEYDLDGNLLKRIDPQGTTTNTWDALNRLTGETFPNARSNSYGYDGVGNLRTFTDRNGTVRYTYNAANENTEVLDPGASAPTRFAYRPDGARTSTTYPNGVVMTSGYDDAVRIESIKAVKGTSVLQDFAYKYRNPSTNRETALRTEFTDATNGQITRYHYDERDRLTRARTGTTGGTVLSPAQACATSDPLCLQWTFDGAGNRLKQDKVGTLVSDTFTTYTPNDANQLRSTSTTSSSGTVNDTYGYDANGNRTSGAGCALAYNIRDQLSSMCGSAQRFLGAGQDQRYFDKNKELQNSALGIVERQSGVSRFTYVRDVAGSLVSQKGPTSGYFLFDALGSITGVTDGAGALTKKFRYDPYGNPDRPTLDSDVYFRFAGGYTDDHSLVHFGQRFYDPRVGTWTQRDPLDQTGDLRQGNLYMYVAADPVNFTDLSGLELDDTDKVAAGLDAGTAACGVAAVATGGGAVGVCVPVAGAAAVANLVNGVDEVLELF